MAQATSSPNRSFVRETPAYRDLNRPGPSNSGQSMSKGATAQLSWLQYTFDQVPAWPAAGMISRLFSLSKDHIEVDEAHGTVQVSLSKSTDKYIVYPVEALQDLLQGRDTDTRTLNKSMAALPSATPSQVIANVSNFFQFALFTPSRQGLRSFYPFARSRKYVLSLKIEPNSRYRELASCSTEICADIVLNGNQGVQGKPPAHHRQSPATKAGSAIPAVVKVGPQMVATVQASLFHSDTPESAHTVPVAAKALKAFRKAKPRRQ